MGNFHDIYTLKRRSRIHYTSIRYALPHVHSRHVPKNIYEQTFTFCPQRFFSCSFLQWLMMPLRSRSRCKTFRNKKCSRKAFLKDHLFRSLLGFAVFSESTKDDASDSDAIIFKTTSCFSGAFTSQKKSCRWRITRDGAWILFLSNKAIYKVQAVSLNVQAAGKKCKELNIIFCVLYVCSRLNNAALCTGKN